MRRFKTKGVTEQKFTRTTELQGKGMFTKGWVSQPEHDPELLSAWPLPRLPNWIRRVNELLTDKEIAAVRWSLKRGSPFGNETWVESTARRLDLESTLRPRGRPQIRNLPNNDS